MTDRFKIKVHYLASIVGLLVLLSSCNTPKYLAPDQALLKNTKIIFKTKSNEKSDPKLKDELQPFITLQPNHKLMFLIPKEYLYVKNTGTNKDKWHHKAIRSIGEPPALFDETEAKEIARNMENYLKYKKGYYDAIVDFFTEEKQYGWVSSSDNDVWSETVLNFVISPGQRYKVKNITYESRDANVLAFINERQQDALIKPGDYIDYNTFEIEKSRLVVDLQNNGFVNFSNNYFEISGDSSKINKEVDIYIEVREPLPDTLHRRFRAGDIRVYTDYYKDQQPDRLTQDTVNQSIYYKQSKEYIVRKEILDNAIYLRSGKLISREDRQKTFRKLNGLGTYRFVTINAIPDKDIDTLMHYDIQLAPFPKKWIWDGGLQGYFSTLGAARLFGLSLSSQFVNRNLLGGSEKYTLRAEIGTELGYDRGKGFVQRTNNLILQNNLTIPSFQDFLGFGKIVNKIGIIKDNFFLDFQESCSTNITLGFSSNNIINLYSLSSFNMTYGFDYTSPTNNRYIFRPLAFNLDLYTIHDASRFARNPLVLLSFQDNLGTGFLFRDLTYIYNSNKLPGGHSFLLINNFEVSGWEVHLANQVYNKVLNKTSTWNLGDKRFAKYVRYELDARYNKEYSKNESLAARLNIGSIVAFGENRAAPFVRQFGVGGPNSLRAWNIKQPGPGGYREQLSKLEVPQTIYANQGDLKLEMNLEYRFKMFYFVDGSLFLDAGNVWLLSKDVERPGAEISKRFMDQIAVGTGYGIRFNFNFFIIRFDFGYKLRSPFKDEFTGRNWYTLKEVRQQGLGNVQVAVNYPF